MPPRDLRIDRDSRRPCQGRGRQRGTPGNRRSRRASSKRCWRRGGHRRGRPPDGQNILHNSLFRLHWAVLFMKISPTIIISFLGAGGKWNGNEREMQMTKWRWLRRHIIYRNSCQMRTTPPSAQSRSCPACIWHKSKICADNGVLDASSGWNGGTTYSTFGMYAPMHVVQENVRFFSVFEPPFPKLSLYAHDPTCTKGFIIAQLTFVCSLLFLM